MPVNALSMSYGTADLDLISYSVNEQPVTKQGIGRVGTSVRFEATAELRATDAQAFADALASAVISLRQDGADLSVWGLAGKLEYQIAAAVCTDGGPFAEIDVTDGDSPLCKIFKVTVNANVVPQDGKDPKKQTPKDSYTVTTETRPDDLLTLTRAGEIDGIDTAKFFLATVVPAVKAAYPPPGWVIDVKVNATQDATQSKLLYAITARQNFSDLPAAGDTMAVDGTATTNITRDENHRLTTDYTYDLLVDGDPIELLTSLRPDDVLKENWNTTSIKENRLRASFTVIKSADDSPLMNFNQTAKLVGGDTVYEEKTYVGADSILVKKNKTLPRLEQSGSAVCLGAYFSAPTPLYNVHAADPDVGYRTANGVEFETTWQYHYFCVDNNGRVPSDPLPDLVNLSRGVQPQDFLDA
jgi:hypothetical protein